MKKWIFICTSILALVLVATLLGTSIYAAINQSLGTNNTITFYGKGDRLCFTLNGEVTGYSIEDDIDVDNYSYTWSYDFDHSPTNTAIWDIGKIYFDATDYDNIHIIYEFSIKNTGNTVIEAWINNVEYDDSKFSVNIDGDTDNIKIIPIGSTETLTWVIKPNTPNYNNMTNCNFRLNIYSIPNEHPEDE